MELKIKELTPFVLKLSNNDESLLPILRDVFEAKNEYFDILLDSVQSIIYNFDINDQKYLINNSFTNMAL